MQVEEKEQKPRTDKRQDRRRPKKDGDAAPKDGENVENGAEANADDQKNGNRDKKDRQPRKPRFTPPENWKAEAEASVTIDSKIPSLPADAERLNRPNYNKLKADLDQADADMDKYYRKIDALKEDAKKVRNEQKDKNSTVFDQLKKLNEDRRVHSTALAENKELKKQYTDRINAADDKLRDVEKKSFSGKLIRKKELTEMIKQKEEEFANTKKTSAEEKKMSDEIFRLKQMIKTIPEFEKLKDEKQQASELLKEIGKKNKIEFEKMQAISDRITELRGRLDETQTKAKAERAEEKEKEKDGEKKPPRVLSEAEQVLEKQRQDQYDQIKLLKDKKQKLREKFDSDWLEFEKQQFELDRIYFMTKIQKNLKWDEREKRRKEEDAKLKIADEEKAKEALQFKYQAEIDLCEQLASHLDDLKPGSKQSKPFEATKEVTSHNVNSDQLKQENLVYIKPKKFDDTDNVVNKKKTKQQKKTTQQKKDVPATSSETDKVNIHFDTLHLFSEIKVAPPTTIGQIDAAIKQLNEKKEYYLALREKEVESAGKEPVVDEKKAAKEGETGEKESEEEQQAKARESRNQRPQKKFDPKEEDFPEL